MIVPEPRRHRTRWLAAWSAAAILSLAAEAAATAGVNCCGGQPQVDKDHLQRMMIRNGAAELRRQAGHARAEEDYQTAVECLRRYLDLHPDDHEAQEELLEVASLRAVPTESRPLLEAQAALPGQFRTHETRRFIVLSDADPQWTRNQAERLERAYHQFQRFARRHGLSPLPLEHKLVCILFERYEDYQSFAAEHDAVADPWIAGYYAPQHDRIVFYNIESNPQLLRARSKLTDLEEELQSLNHKAAEAERNGDPHRADALRNHAAQYEAHMKNERLRVEAFARRVMVATTVHEAVHQLAFHTRIQSPYVHYPLWISEGLATAFETDTPGHAFGPDHEYEPRRETFEKMLAKDQIIPIATLARLSDLNGAPEWQVRAVYHQSYALFTWIDRFRAEELRHYLHELRREPAGRQDQKRLLEIFTNAFGDPEQLERAWLRHERRRLN